jgi:anti-sigma regulatory factor (Ser/Thr protein kinase)
MNATLQHEGLIYGSDDAFLQTVVPFLQRGIANGDGTVVVTNARNRDALARALGRDADTVRFVADTEVYATPHGALTAYTNVLREFADDGYDHVTAVGEVLHGSSSDWMRYESLAHVVLAGEPLHVICPYDERRLAPEVVEHVRRTHPVLHGAHGCEASTSFEEPEVLLREWPLRISFELLRDPDLVVDAIVRDPQPARRTLADAVERTLPEERAEEAILAIGELLANGIRHGKGSTDAALWVLDDAVICKIRNEGPWISDPCAGYRPPADPHQGGMGLWLARQLADEFEITHDRTGPSVTVAFAR